MWKLYHVWEFDKYTKMSYTEKEKKEKNNKKKNCESEGMIINKCRREAKMSLMINL